MRASKTAVAVALGYLALVGALIAFEYREFIHPPGDGRWVGMLSALATMPTSFVVAAINRQMGGATAGESPGAFVLIMGVAAVLNAAALFALISALSRPRAN